jgi:hypothetical protein
MAWIKIIREDEATGRLKELYDTDYDQSWGGVDNILKLSRQSDTNHGND